MKVSEWLRQYQITGVVPEAPKGEELIAFWAGWPDGHQQQGQHHLKKCGRTFGDVN